MGADFIYVMCERAVPYETALERIEAMSPEEIAEKWDMVFDPEIDFHGEVKKQPPNLTAGEFNRSE